MNMAKVFIYGTLKRGFPLFDKGMAGTSYLGDYQTVARYPLYIAQDFFGPVMLNQPDTGLQVRGELFDVPEDQLPILDELESVGTPGSFRATLEVEPVGGGERHLAICYFKDESWLHPLHSDHLPDYQDRRFVPPWQR